jgi:hypothetical protein
MAATSDRSEPRHAERAARSGERIVLLADGLADGLVDDFDLVELVDQLVLDCVDLLDVVAAGVLLANGDPSHDVVVASDELSRDIMRTEVETGSGPGRHAIDTSEPATHTNGPELAARWPAFAAALGEAGYARVHTIPMQRRDDTIGALSLFASPAVPISDLDRSIATSLARAATVGIVHHRAIDRLSILAEQLQLALNSRVVIERAIGVVAEYGGVEMGAAFDAIRTYARRSRSKLTVVAEALTNRSLHPGQVIEARGRR